MGELQARCTNLEEEKYEALAKVRESVQVAEEAALLKDQVTLSSFSVPSPVSLCTFRHPFPTEMCVCLYPLASGLVKGETESRRAREDKGCHQTVNPGCHSPHPKGGKCSVSHVFYLWHMPQYLYTFYVYRYVFSSV